MNRKKLALLTCFLSLATAASGKNLTLEERVEYLEKMLEQQISRNQVLEEKLNATLEKEKKEEKVLLVQLDGEDAEKVKKDAEKAKVQQAQIENRLSKLEKEADQWELHGYASLQYRSTDDWSSSSSTFGKGDFFLGIPGTGESSNQVELVAKRKFEGKNGVFGDLNLRAEYGNGDSYYYSSSGKEHDNGVANFEVKEAFINMGGFSYLPENATIWAGRRFLNRNSTSLSGEFYKQSSGVGFGYERNGLSLAVVGVDPGAEDGKQKSTLPDGNGRRTVTALDFNYAGIKVPGGSLDIGAKYYFQPNAHEMTSNWKYDSDKPATDKNNENYLNEQKRRKNFAKDGFGLGVVYNTNYYGFDGFASHSINYGYGIGAHATGGMNFGQWTDEAVKDAYVTLLTSGGMMNVNDKWQVMTEMSVMHGDKLYGLSGELTRAGFSVQPSYKVNDNFRMVFGATVGMQHIENYEKHWGAEEATQYRYGLSIAPTFTADSDFFGRPQIQPYVTWLRTNFENGFGGDLKKENSQVIFGVKSEVWF